jgi:hypothetical protein
VRSALSPPIVEFFDGGAFVKWRHALVGLVVLLFVLGVGAAIGLQEPPPPTVFTGHVDIGTGADGKLLILIDIDTAGQPADGLVDQVFRLQSAAFVNYSGPATVTYVRGRVTVQMSPTGGWVFTVIGRQLPPPDSGLTAYQVSGIVRMWGSTVHQSPTTLFATLSSTNCSKTSSLAASSLNVDSGDPSCKKCQTGGPGVMGCSMDCGGGSSCSADCDSDTYACCSCSSGCGCCGNSEAHH